MKTSFHSVLLRATLGLSCIALASPGFAQKGDLKKFCAKQNISAIAEKAWQRTSCPELVKKVAAQSQKDVFDEFFQRLTKEDWSGYEFPFSTKQIKDLNQLEASAEYDDTMPKPYAFSKVVEALSKGKVPRAEAALVFLLSALEFADASHAEAVATGLGEAFEKNPEIFIKALAKSFKQDPHALKSARLALDFAYRENAKPIPAKVKSTALKLEKLPENKEIALFFDDIKELR